MNDIMRLFYRLASAGFAIAAGYYMGQADPDGAIVCLLFAILIEMWGQGYKEGK